MKKLLLLCAVIFSAINSTEAQVPTCSPSVPYFFVDFTGNPSATWVSPGHSRVGNCCGTTPPDNCTSFEIICDTNTAMLIFEFESGAVPSGSMYYQLNCGPQIPVGNPICITGPNPHYLTFCKPGNNQNTYRITAIARPTFPPQDTTRIGCSHPIALMGMEDSTVTWNSIYPGAPGDYNSYLNCTSGCDTVIYTPAANAPSYVEYLVCGVPIATACGYLYTCDTIRMYNIQPLGGSVSPNPAGFCVGGPGVTVTATGSGGLAPYTYIWRDQSLNQICNTSSCLISNAGIYSIEINDALMDSAYCPSVFLSATVTVTSPPLVDAGPDQTLCPTAPVVVLNGSVQNAPGGIWSGGGGSFNPGPTSLLTSYSPTPAEIAAGQVTLTLTSTGASGGCPNDSDQVIIYFPSPLTVTVADTTVNCFGDYGTLTATVSGGIAPYTYQWTTGQITSSISAGQGTYCVYVTDLLGCIASSCGTVFAPSQLFISMSSTPCSTNGGSDGTASTTVSGGTPPYTYLWNTGATTSTITGLSYGIYTVTATDANGCTIYSSVVVNEPRCTGFAASVSGSDILCFGGENGSATAVPNAGTGPYTYLWNDATGQTTATATNLAGGVYQCVITDANGCLAVVNISLTQPTAMNNTMTHSNVTTVGGNDGAADANPWGGTPSYTYLWSTGATTSTITGLSSGTYWVIITDQNGCSITDSVQINEPPCANLVAGVAMNNVSCNGDNDGSANSVVLFGINPITYLWSTGDTTASVTGLSAGNYNVTITDSIGCNTFVNFVITEPAPLSIALAAVNISCTGINDGTIELTVNGGTFPYTYVWSNGLPTEDIINLSQGTYSVTVTDANGCSVTDSATISEPAPVILTSIINPVLCFGGSTGYVDVSLTGGVYPYNYSWSNGANTQDITGLTTGQYIITVTDANGCTASLSALVDQPDTVLLLSADAACAVPGSGLSLVTMIATGGNQGSYQFSVDGGTTYLPYGVYTILLPVDSSYIITVRDTFGCPGYNSIALTIAPEPEILTVIYPQCIPDGVDSVTVTLVVTGGNGGPLQASFDNGNTWLAPGVYSVVLATGQTYSIVVRDSSGCISVTETITISTDFALNGIVAQVQCNGDSTGSIDLAINGAPGTYTYNWSNGAMTEDISGLAAGTYSVIVTNINGCADTIAFTLTEPAPLGGTLASVNNYNGFDISCNGSTNGGVDLTVNGGVGPYSYLWSNGSTSEDLSGISAGTYSVSVTDANGCSFVSSIALTEPSALGVNAVVIDVACNGLSTGEIDITVTGGVGSCTYIWSNGSVAEDVNALYAGSYTVQVTDQNGCTLIASFTISEPPPFTVSATMSNYNGYNVSCFGSNDGSINLVISGGSPAYTYTWSNGLTSADLIGITAGTYSVVVTDANGCTATQTFILTAPPALAGIVTSMYDYSGFDVSCYGSIDGGIDLSVSGGSPSYSYSWSNGGTNQDITNVGAGSYYVIVTDQNGCTLTASITLSEPGAIVNTAIVQGVPCNGFNSGSIDVTTSGGVAPYTYYWSGGQQTQDLSNLGAGVYSLVTLDANGCMINGAYVINELSPVVLSATQVGPFCYGESNGSIDLTVTGGTIPFTITWSNGSTSEDMNNIPAGTYIVTVTDVNNCTASDTFYLAYPLILTSSISSPVNSSGHNISHFGMSDGSIDLTVEGGTAPYAYQWSNGATTQDLTGVPAGTYSVIITDANGCTSTAAITLDQPLELEMPTGFSPNGDGHNDFFEVHGIEAYPNNHIEIYNRWGNLVWDADNYTNRWAGTNESGDDLPDATYFVILNINNGQIILKGYVDIRRQ